MRAIWKGAVSFGLVSIGVKLFSATEEKDIRFHQVHRTDGGRIKYKRTCSIDGEEVSLGNRRGVVRLHAKLFDGVRRGVLIAESLWPNSAYPDGRGINTLTGADPVAPFGGAAFHDNKVWLKKRAH